MGLCPIAPSKGFPIVPWKPSAANTLFSGIYDFDSTLRYYNINDNKITHTYSDGDEYECEILSLDKDFMYLFFPEYNETAKLKRLSKMILP